MPKKKPARPKNPRFEVYQGMHRETYAQTWRWRLFAKNGEILASGEGFTRRHDAERAVRAVIRAVAQITEKREVFTAPDLQPIADAVLQNFDRKREVLGTDSRPIRKRGRTH